MKKALLSLFAAAIAIISMSAQDAATENPVKKPYFGVRFGAQITIPSEIDFGGISMDLFNSGAGFEVGGIYNIPIVGKFYIEPGLNLFYNTYSFNNEFVDAVSSNSVKVNSVSIRKFGMTIPVLAGFQFNFSNGIGLSVYAGPELEIGLSGKEVTKGQNFEISSTVFGEEGGMNRVNLLMTVGVGVSYKHIYFTFKESPGMVNMLRDTDAEFYENRIALTLGYNF